jgi:tryptophan synthase beta subunit
MKVVTLTEGILPALETAHAIAALPMLLAGPTGRAGSAGRRAAAAPWPDETVVLVGFSGRGDKDLAALERFADVEPWEAVR